MFLALATLALGCNTAKLTPRPDAGVDCVDPTAEYPCTPIDDGGAGCPLHVADYPVFGRDITVDASYPAACTVIVNNPVPEDDLSCTTLGTCHCEADAGAYSWVCFAPQKNR